MQRLLEKIIHQVRESNVQTIKNDNKCYSVFFNFRHPFIMSFSRDNCFDGQFIVLFPVEYHSLVRARSTTRRITKHI